MLGRVGRILLALVVCGAIGLVAAPGAQAGVPDIYVKRGDVRGEYSSDTICEQGCLELYSWQWRATCAGCPAVVPSEGDFQLLLRGTPFDPATCLARRVSGDVTFTSTDPLFPSETTVTPVSGRLRDRKAFVVDGMVSSGAFAGASVSLLVSFPPNPCNPGDFDAAVRFH
jgi:hypothetical protein